MLIERKCSYKSFVADQKCRKQNPVTSCDNISTTVQSIHVRAHYSCEERF